MADLGAEKHGSPFDVLTTTAVELQKSLENGELTSKQIIETYWMQIQRHNHAGLKLRALISTPPLEDLIAIAESLDQERASGRTRSRFHGIPIIVKVGSAHALHALR